MKIPSTLVLPLLAGLTAMPGSSAEGHISLCEKLLWANGILSIEASPGAITHIELPEAAVLDPVVGSPTWSARAVDRVVMIKPLAAEAEEGRQTSVTIFGRSQHYVIHARRVKGREPRCYNLKRDDIPEPIPARPGGAPGARRAGAMPRHPSSRAPVVAAPDSVVPQPPAPLSTRYSVQGRGDEPPGVWDDGRFTWIRLDEDDPVYTVSAAAGDGGMELVDYRFDPVSRLYRITGIHDRILLRNGTAKVLLRREK